MACKPALKKAPESKETDFAAAFAALRRMLVPYADRFHVAHDTPEHFYLETKTPVYKGKPLMFAAVRMGRAYVSYHLFPIYMKPALAAKISPELKLRMQGKSCFNFAKLEPSLIEELASLTASSVPAFKEAGEMLQNSKSASTRKKK
jgi:hypothetical protein